MEKIMKGRWRRKRTPQLFGPLTNIHFNVVEVGEEEEGRSERLRRTKQHSSGFEQRDESKKEEQTMRDESWSTR